MFYIYLYIILYYIIIILLLFVSTTMLKYTLYWKYMNCIAGSSYSVGLEQFLLCTVAGILLHV